MTGQRIEECGTCAGSGAVVRIGSMTVPLPQVRGSYDYEEPCLRCGVAGHVVADDYGETS